MTTLGKHEFGKRSVQKVTLLGLFLLAAAYSATAHDFYPVSCCGGGPTGDCHVVAASRVKTDSAGHTLDGKHFKSHGETLTSPDGAYHACFPKILKGRIGCFFAPPPNS